tara:strand:+ start:1784 stop:1987 length:204 start_codon:yes stop_codon:yes gene_type:complete
MKLVWILLVFILNDAPVATRLAEFPEQNQCMPAAQDIRVIDYGGWRRNYKPKPICIQGLPRNYYVEK